MEPQAEQPKGADYYTDNTHSRGEGGKGVWGKPRTPAADSGAPKGVGLNLLAKISLRPLEAKAAASSPFRWVGAPPARP